jgi:hypothetical protein
VANEDGDGAGAADGVFQFLLPGHSARQVIAVEEGGDRSVAQKSSDALDGFAVAAVVAQKEIVRSVVLVFRLIVWGGCHGGGDYTATPQRFVENSPDDLIREFC